MVSSKICLNCVFRFRPELGEYSRELLQYLDADVSTSTEYSKAWERTCPVSIYIYLQGGELCSLLYQQNGYCYRKVQL